MADWKKVAMAAILADGKIDETEVRVLKKALWADGKISDSEVQFLIELRTEAQKKAKAKKENLTPAFEKLFFKAIEENILKDGKIDETEAKWLRTALFADGKIDAGERKFLEGLKKKAKSTSDEFNKLCEEADAKAKAAKAKAAKAKAAK